MTLSGDAYQAAFDARARQGADVHGEAGFVESLGVRSVLDAGCGTGRVAIELARRGLEVVGVDVEQGMLAVARRAAAALRWELADLATLDLDDGGGGRLRVDAAVLAGNVMLFVAPGTEALVVAALARHLVPGGLLVAGFQIGSGLTPADYDGMCAAAGLSPAGRWSTWDRHPWTPASDYAVSVHRSAPDGGG
ncbi:MAG TPA: class I SAM-dependent methyltransferase [Candidatus Dormibacteraeota bacterium]|nr:class I SAM-dependent methyltransferase [Candidatus Dormibacteraeota bacterium]